MFGVVDMASIKISVQFMSEGVNEMEQTLKYKMCSVSATKRVGTLDL